MKKITEIHCSALARPMSCAGSLQIEKLNTTNEAAQEGTAAGEYLRRLLDPVWALTQDAHKASNGVFYDDDMKFYTEVIAKEITDNVEGEVLCEQRIDWTTRSGITIKGQYDASFVRGRKLYIDDLKYGWNIVTVEKNWQLLGYAIGEVIRRGVSFDSIVLRIHQPRPHHEDGTTRSWEISYAELIEYKEQIEQRMELISEGNTQLVTGPQCKYCPGAAESCTSFNRAFNSSIDHVVDGYIQDHIDEREISHQLDILERATEVLKIKSDSLKELAINRIKGGKLIPGYATEASYGNREWKRGLDAQTIQVLSGVDITKKEMMSPAQAEKSGVPKELVSFYVDRYYKGDKLKRTDHSKLGNKIFGAQDPKQ